MYRSKKQSQILSYQELLKKQRRWFPIEQSLCPKDILDLLTAIKTSINKYTVATTATENPHIRRALHDQLDTAVYLHDELSDLLLEKGWLG
ncbi:spore coat protein [Bacillus subtilis]|uniref:spore coat protein n=1 Tax=Bacillus subtilis TaxID=1423 RepID=UPI000FF8D134|nr:spore coat protein [Bacillus subtilis]QAR60895.1 spore coat protein [Bacillus subtilis]